MVLLYTILMELGGMKTWHVQFSSQFKVFLKLGK